MSKKKKLIVGGVGTAIGSFLIVLGDLSLGISLETSIRNLGIVIAASFACVIIWTSIVRLRRLAKK